MNQKLCFDQAVESKKKRTALFRLRDLIPTPTPTAQPCFEHSFPQTGNMLFFNDDTIIKVETSEIAVTSPQIY